MIDADALIDKMCDGCDDWKKGLCDHDTCVTPYWVKEAPTIDAEPVRHGTWILHADGSGTCMECRSRQKHVWDYDNWQHYCGCCGAKMDRGVGDEGTD